MQGAKKRPISGLALGEQSQPKKENGQHEQTHFRGNRFRRQEFCGADRNGPGQEREAGFYEHASGSCAAVSGAEAKEWSGWGCNDRDGVRSLQLWVCVTGSSRGRRDRLSCAGPDENGKIEPTEEAQKRRPGR